MIELKLTNSDIPAIVSDVDYNRVKNFSWFLKKANSCWYVATSKRVNGKVKTIYLHRLIMNCPSNMSVHHKNSITLNNTQENLEICSLSDNARKRFFKEK